MSDRVCSVSRSSVSPLLASLALSPLWGLFLSRPLVLSVARADHCRRRRLRFTFSPCEAADLSLSLSLVLFSIAPLSLLFACLLFFSLSLSFVRSAARTCAAAEVKPTDETHRPSCCRGGGGESSPNRDRALLLSPLLCTFSFLH